MIARIVRMLRVELLKLFAHPFLGVSAGLVLVATVLAAYAESRSATEWAPAHTVGVFAVGAKWGLQMASYVLVIFGAMLVAGEYDRGTVKVLLTRPITRTEVFVAKSLTGLLLAVGLIAAVLAAAWACGCLWGRLGPVWDEKLYFAQAMGPEIEAKVGRALATAVLGVAAACFVGLLVSNLVESSGFAVAISLVVFIAADAGATFFDSWRTWWLNTYPGYAFDTLSKLAEGTSAFWRPEWHDRALPQLVPLGTMLLSAAAAYGVFRFKNVTA